MRKFLGILVIIGGALLGIYVALYVCLFGGIVQILTALKQTNPDVVQIAGGIVRVICTGFAGAITFWACFFVGGAILTSESRSSRLSRLTGRNLR